MDGSNLEPVEGEMIGTSQQEAAFRRQPLISDVPDLLNSFACTDIGGGLLADDPFFVMQRLVNFRLLLPLFRF